MSLPRDGKDYPLSLLVAVRNSLFRVCEDPTLEDARAVLEAIEAELKR